jgi:DNA modification methylase
VTAVTLDLRTDEERAVNQTWALHLGSALDVLQTLPAASVDCCVTSPPYWGLRSYEGADGQYGLEPTFTEYIAHLVAVFAEVWRVLKPGAACWLNLGDSYAASGPAGGAGKQHTNVGSINAPIRRPPIGLKPKDLVGIPWRVAFALQDAGWWLRSGVVWAKSNPMPESVQDRPTTAHEFVFLLTNAERYYFNADAIRTAYAPSSLPQLRVPYESEARKDFAAAGVQNASDIKRRIVAKSRAMQGTHRKDCDRWREVDGGVAERGVTANARTVWTINTEPSPLDHFAVMPKALARKCIVSACPPGGVVLDMFAGVSTTGVVALEEGRSFIGIELSPKYHAIGRERLAGVAPLLACEAVS